MGALLTAYIGDNLVIRWRTARNLTPFATLEVKRYYAIRQKNQRVEFAPLDPETRPCANSLLPQFGRPPCWYLRRHAVERIDM